MLRLDQSGQAGQLSSASSTGTNVGAPTAAADDTRLGDDVLRPEDLSAASISPPSHSIRA
jgi:hypothetical protein